MQKFRVRSIQNRFGRTWQLVVEMKCAVGDDEVEGDEFSVGCFTSGGGFIGTRRVLGAGKAHACLRQYICLL